MSNPNDASASYTDPNSLYYTDPAAYAAYYQQYYAAAAAAAGTGVATAAGYQDYAGYYTYDNAGAASASGYGTGAKAYRTGSGEGGGAIRGHDSRNGNASSSAPYNKPIDPKEAFDAAFGKDKKERKHKPVLRAAGGEVWEDATLTEEWDPNDFRIFCGDLSNDCTDAALESAFRKYPSFLKARVVRDKKTMKTRGYGFVSFKDVNDYMAAMREMNGKYVANRPLKLRKSNWQERNVATKGLKKVMETDIMKLAAMAAKKR